MKASFPVNSAGVTDWRENLNRSVRTEGCILFLCTAGMSVVSINRCRKVFKNGQLLVVTSDMYVSADRISSNFSAKYISLSFETLETSYFRITDMTLWNKLHFHPVLSLDNEMHHLYNGWLEQNEWILQNIPKDKHATMIGYNLYNLFMSIGLEFEKADSPIGRDKINHSREILNRFWGLLTKNSPQIRSVKFYAESLCITPGYLYKICRRVYGVSPKELIDEMLTVEIKTLLSDTTLSVKLIADQLQFEDDSYMCRFFRRMTGKSPLEYRAQTNAITSPT